MIREALLEDVDTLVVLEEALFPSNPWPKKQFLYELNENPFCKIFVYEIDGNVVGYVDVWVIYENAQIANIAVSKAFQGKKLGNALLNYAIDYSIDQDCENLTLEVRVSNQTAINLYEKNGFIHASIRKNYYEDGENAYLMVKPIGGLKNDVNFSN